MSREKYCNAREGETINPLYAPSVFVHPLKILENQRVFFLVFRGYEKRPVV